MFDPDSEKRAIKAQREAFADETARLAGILGAMQAELTEAQAELKTANETIADLQTKIAAADEADRHKAE